MWTQDWKAIGATCIGRFKCKITAACPRGGALDGLLAGLSKALALADSAPNSLQQPVQQRCRTALRAVGLQLPAAGEPRPEDVAVRHVPGVHHRLDT